MSYVITEQAKEFTVSIRSRNTVKINSPISEYLYY